MKNIQLNNTNIRKVIDQSNARGKKDKFLTLVLSGFAGFAAGITTSVLTVVTNVNSDNAIINGIAVGVPFVPAAYAVTTLLSNKIGKHVEKEAKVKLESIIGELKEVDPILWVDVENLQKAVSLGVTHSQGQFHEYIEWFTFFEDLEHEVRCICQTFRSKTTFYNGQEKTTEYIDSTQILEPQDGAYFVERQEEGRKLYRTIYPVKSNT